jgi:hypothetical protein
MREVHLPSNVPTLVVAATAQPLDADLATVNVRRFPMFDPRSRYAAG